MLATSRLPFLCIQLYHCRFAMESTTTKFLLDTGHLLMICSGRFHSCSLTLEPGTSFACWECSPLATPSSLLEACRTQARVP